MGSFLSTSKPSQDVALERARTRYYSQCKRIREEHSKTVTRAKLCLAIQLQNNQCSQLRGHCNSKLLQEHMQLVIDHQRRVEEEYAEIIGQSENRMISLLALAVSTYDREVYQIRKGSDT